MDLGPLCGNIQQCRYILDTGDTSDELIFAISSLLKIVAERKLASDVSLDIRDNLVNYLAGPDLPDTVIQPLIQLLCRLTKSGWFDDGKFKDLVNKSWSLLGLPTSQHRAVGLMILNQLVSEMNQVPPGLPPPTLQLRVLCSFREESLVRIFEISLEYLQCYKNDAAELQELALSLALRCLSFDFDGTAIYESSDEFGSVQVSSSWRFALEQSSTLQIFFESYAITKPPISKAALECLVRLASVRRSVFRTDAARSKYLSDLMKGIKNILQSGQGLGEPDNYHEFCRLLGSFGVNYQWQEIESVEGNSDWIQLLAQFTSSSLQYGQKGHFPFLEERCSCSRTTFYYTIGCLIFMEDSPVKLKSLMEPLLKVFISLESLPDTVFRSDNVKYSLIGLARDLRGIAKATNSCRTYKFLFDWLYPERMQLLLRGITLWADTPEVTTPLLKFMAEFVLNRAQRVAFNSFSANGILLFREVSKLIVAYGSGIVSLINAPDIYSFKYKGIWICVTILTRALAGNYVNFAVFELCGDRALADALDMALKMTLSIPLEDILVFPKLTRAYFEFLDVLFSSHISVVLNLDTNNFQRIAGALQSGLSVLDTNISSQCASAIDNLGTFYFNNITQVEAPSLPAAVNLSQHIAQCPTLFPQILKTLFELCLFKDCSDQRSLSRPILSLILSREELCADLKDQILASQPVDQHQRLQLCFNKLGTGVSRSLDSENRDKFTQNMTVFRTEFRVN